MAINIRNKFATLRYENDDLDTFLKFGLFDHAWRRHQALWHAMSILTQLVKVERYDKASHTHLKCPVP